MKRVLSIYLPQWDIQLHKRPSPSRHKADPAVPVLLIRSTARLERVVRCCPVAAALGARPGMLLADARAACGTQVTVAPFDAGRSLHALHRLARWMQRFSPVAAVDPRPKTPGDTPDGLLLDMTGTAHLFGGEQLLLVEIATRLARMGLSSRLAIAPTLGCAWALARFAPEALTIFGSDPSAEAETVPPQKGQRQKPNIENPLAPLPVSALRLSAEIVEKLHSVGIENIGQVLILPRESLLQRFGEEVLLRIDQARGRVPELLTPVHEEPPASIVRPFDGPTLSLEGIFLRLQEMLAQLTDLLEQQESGIRGLRLQWIRMNAPPLSRDLITATPTRDPRHLWKLLQPKVETMQMGSGVEAMSLTAFWTQPMLHRQNGIWQDEHADEDLSFREFLDRVINRWGEEGHVWTAAPAASHVPEEARRFLRLGVRSQASPPEASMGSIHMHTHKTAGNRNGFKQAAIYPLSLDASLVLRHSSNSRDMLPLDRPTCLLDQPEPIEVIALQPDLPPVRVQWRGMWHPVLCGFGPERLMTPWWRVPPAPVRSVTRDYYKVETPAGWLWIYREGAGWFAHGMWS